MAAEGKLDHFIHSDKRPKPVVCEETGMVYPSIKAARRAVGFYDINKACVIKDKTCGGMHWHFLEQDEKQAV